MTCSDTTPTCMAKLSLNLSLTLSSTFLTLVSNPGQVTGTGTQRFYGWVDVTDNGTTLTATFTGYDTADAARVTSSVTISDGAPGTIDGVRIGGSSPSAVYVGSQPATAIYIGDTKVWP